MDDTGRIRGTLREDLASIVFGTTVDHAIDEDLDLIVEVDRAHVIMLAECGVLASATATRLLRTMADLRATAFADLRGGRARRGLYLHYEDYLAKLHGPSIGGALQTARSRNDLGAAVARLKLRAPIARLHERLVNLLQALLRRAEEHAATVMPLYTHFQPAVPVTLGHYLAGVATALLRDLRQLVDAGTELDRSPLGAGAGGGTSFAVHPERVADLLGFASVATNSIDAVASRDVVLRVLAALSIASTTMSRLAADLLLWSTQEFGFLKLPDTVVGSSSMMPQKRNPFLLEHVVGRAGSPLGAFVAASMSMHAAPFSNSASVSHEGVRPIWNALAEGADAVLMLHAVVDAAEVDASVMALRARQGMVSATRLAEWLVQEHGLAYRVAHQQVGRLVTAAFEAGVGLQEAAAAAWGPSLENELDPATACATSRYGLAAGAAAVHEALPNLGRQLAAVEADLGETQRRWQAARARLNAIAEAITSARPEGACGGSL